MVKLKRFSAAKPLTADPNVFMYHVTSCFLMGALRWKGKVLGCIAPGSSPLLEVRLQFCIFNLEYLVPILYLS
jgi:hypothetical protein